MFTGIVGGRAAVRSVERREGASALTIALDGVLAERLEVGASIAVCGVCLTVSRLQDSVVTFDVMGETLAATTLGLLQPGDEVTIERSVRYGDEVGGHRVSGHVDTVARIVSVDQPENNYVVTFSVEGPWCRYLFRKGFVALDGASLTIAAVDRVAGAFSVWLIPETLRRTRFGSLKPGDRVNLEVDRETQAVVDTVIDLVTQPGFKEWVRDEACA